MEIRFKLNTNTILVVFVVCIHKIISNKPIKSFRLFNVTLEPSHKLTQDRKETLVTV